MKLIFVLALFKGFEDPCYLSPWLKQCPWPPDAHTWIDKRPTRAPSQAPALPMGPDCIDITDRFNNVLRTICN